VRRGAPSASYLVGFDTFAYRQRLATRYGYSKSIITARRGERRRLDARVSPAANLEYVAIDFETTRCARDCSEAALILDPTFFSCLGVLVYLTRDAVDAIFELSQVPQGSEIAFTFSPRTARLGPG